MEVHSAHTLIGGHMMHLALSLLQAEVMMMMIWIAKVININMGKICRYGHWYYHYIHSSCQSNTISISLSFTKNKEILH